MSIVFVLVPLTLFLVGIACWAFFWAADDGQFDDLATPAWDILQDHPPSATTRPTNQAPRARQ